MITKQQFNTLGLKEEDFAIFSALQTDSLSVSDIARAVHIPRTSLVRPLKRLHNRKIIRKYTIGRKVMWKAITETELLKKIYTLFPGSTEGTPKDGKTVILSTHNDLIAAYEQILRLPTKYPVYAVQSNESMASMIKHYPSKKLEMLNTGIKNKRLIVHAILEEDVIERFGGLLEKHNHLKPAMYKSVHGRSAVTRYVPKNTFSSSAEIWAWNGVVVMANWEQGTGIVLRDENVYTLVTELVKLFEEMTRSVDQNPLLSKLAEINTV